MISLVEIDDIIKERLGLIKLSLTSIKVYPYIPDREKGDTVYPCVAFQRLQHHIINSFRRPGQSIFIPSVEQQTIEIDRMMGGGTVTGPVGYIRKPYPTPVTVTYEIHTLATRKDHAEYLLAAMLSAIPHDYTPQCSDMQTPQFVFDRPINLDDLVKPEFRTSYLYDVTPVWIDRLEAWDSAPITSPIIAFETVETS